MASAPSNSGWSRLDSSTPSRVSHGLRAAHPGTQPRASAPQPGGRWWSSTVAQRAVGDLRRHPGEGRLTAPVGGGAGVEQAQPGLGRGVPRDVAVPEDQHVDVRVGARAAPFPAGRGAGLVHHREPDAAQLDARHLGQPGPQRRRRRCCRTRRRAARARASSASSRSTDTQSPAWITTSAASTAAHTGAGRSFARTGRWVSEIRSSFSVSARPPGRRRRSASRPGLIAPPAPRSP